MEKLKELGLFGGDVVTVDGTEAVRHYNNCLGAIDLEPTKLKKFTIDGLGWSPEIAREKGDHYYLCHTMANPFAIVVSPEQKGKPVYTPFHSFDRDLMRVVFKSSGRQISCLTADTGIFFEMDQRLSFYRDPRDLLMIDSVVARANSIGDIMDAARRQRELVSRFNQGDNWSNKDLRREILESSNIHGDLRTKPVIIEDIPFNNVRSFHARAFGGVYVFRDEFGEKPPLLILEGDDKEDVCGDEVVHIKNHSKILEKLIELGFLKCDFGSFDQLALTRIKDVMLSEAIFAHNPDENVGSLLNPAKRKSYVRQLNGSLPEEFHEMEKLIIRLERKEPISVDKLPQGLFNLLLRPLPSCRDENPLLFELLMKLIVNLQPMPPEVVYGYDKNLFFDRYTQWTEAKRQWAIGWIRENRVKKNHQ